MFTNANRGAMDMTFFLTDSPLSGKKMDLCREIAWNCPRNGIEYYRIEEVNRIYVFLASLNLKFDIIRRRILG